MPKIVLIGGRRFDQFLSSKLKKKDFIFISLPNLFNMASSIDFADSVIIGGSPYLSRKFNVQINQKDFEFQLTNVLLKLKPKNIVFISSAAVYGLKKIKNIPIREASEFNPSDEYGEEKCLLELCLEKYTNENEVSTLVLRPAGFFSCFTQNGFNSFIDRVLNPPARKSHSFIIQNGGRQIRDFCEFSFLCDVILTLHNKTKIGTNCLNIKNTNGFRIGDICTQVGDSITFNYENDDGRELIHSELDISRLRTVARESNIILRYFNTLDEMKCI